MRCLLNYQASGNKPAGQIPTLGDQEVKIRHIEGEHGFAQEAFTVLRTALPSITGYFLVSKPFPKVRVVLVPDRDEFDRLIRDLLRVEIEIPSNPARIAQPQRTDMVILSPSPYERHSVFKHIRDNSGERRDSLPGEARTAVIRGRIPDIRLLLP